jgi:hypothetical protein
MLDSDKRREKWRRCSKWWLDGAGHAAGGARMSRHDFLSCWSRRCADAGITLVHVVCLAAGYPYYCPGYVGSPVMSGSGCRMCARLRLPLSH